MVVVVVPRGSWRYWGGAAVAVVEESQAREPDDDTQTHQAKLTRGR